MFYNLINTLKRRVILELQDSFSKHPVYSKVVPFIQNKFAFDERPQFGIVVKGSSANKVQLSADNFKGTVQSHVMLAYVGAPTYPLEWVREDLATVRANGDHMPIAPGVYFIEILTAPTNPTEPGTYAVDPLLTQTDEPVLRFQSGIEREAQLQNIPVQRTLRMWLNRRVLLAEGKDFTVNYTDGSITFIARFEQNDFVVASYRYAAPSFGPVNWYWNTADFKALPGVVLAFGKRGKAGDKVAVVVYPDREDTANAYGGRFDVSFDLDVITTDANQTEEVADLAIMYMWGEKRSGLSFDGIEIVDMSMGGEAEETYDETADVNYYTSSLALQLQVEWEIHIPLPFTISRVTSGTAPAGLEGGNAPVMQIATSDLVFQTVPIIDGRNHAFERITLPNIASERRATVPKYTFECVYCEVRFERTLKMGNHTEYQCPACEEQAPRVLDGFAFAFAPGGSAAANSGVHDHDYPTADKVVGRDADARWEVMRDREAAKAELRKKAGTTGISRFNDKDGTIEYTTMTKSTIEARRKLADAAIAKVRGQKAVSGR